MSFGKLLFRKTNSAGFSTGLISKKPYGCQYVSFEIPKRLFKVADAFLRLLKIQPKEYNSLHLRRGDQKTACPSTLKRMEFYFDCWQKKVNISSFPMLLFTDERDIDYLNGLRKVASNYGVDLKIDCESIVDSYFQPGFKIGVFETTKILQENAKYKFEIRRSYSCNQDACNRFL